MIRSLQRYILILIIVGLVATNAIVWRAALAPRVLTMRVFEAGKGKAVLAMTPSGRTLLIDFNSDASILRALGSSLPFWHRSIDVVISSCPDLVCPKSAGVAELRRRYRVSQYFSSTTRGVRLNFNDGAFIDVIWPPKNIDDASVFLLTYGTTSFLIKPTISPRTEKYLSSLNLPIPDFVVSSSTSTGTFISNGMVVSN